MHRGQLDRAQQRKENGAQELEVLLCLDRVHERVDRVVLLGLLDLCDIDTIQHRVQRVSLDRR